MRLSECDAFASEVATIVARECQEIAKSFVEHYGRKEGLYKLGRAVGADSPERRGRSLYEGNAGRIEAHEWVLARLALADLRHAQRKAETDARRAEGDALLALLNNTRDLSKEHRDARAHGVEGGRSMAVAGAVV